jgi:GNAT superfamily N-acetyltransferase
LQEKKMIEEMTTDAQVLATREVMRQLRPHIVSDDYLPTIKRMMQTDGYHLAAVHNNGTVQAVAGYRYMEMLYCGRILYVDDLNTDEDARSKGHGKALMEWLKAEARKHGCAQLHLDSGVQRESTHRFYFRERLTINAYHFRVTL